LTARPNEWDPWTNSLTETDIVREKILAVGALSFATSRHYVAQLADRKEQLVYCDLVRLKHNTGFQNNWSNPSRPSEGNYQPDAYDECKEWLHAGYDQVFRWAETSNAALHHGKGEKVPEHHRNMLGSSAIKLTSFQNAEAPYKKVEDLEKIRLTDASKKEPEDWQDWCLQIAKLGRVVADFYDLFDSTVLHEVVLVLIKSAV
jgi:hypothetical protein